MNTAYMTPVSKITEQSHDWRDSAPCGAEDPDLFFDRAEEDEAVAAQAKAVCNRCPLRSQCLDTAMLSREEFGIWGGMTADERIHYLPMWERLNGGRGSIRARRESSGILIHDPSIERRYTARLKAAQKCRRMLLESDDFHRREEFLSVLELIIAHPTEDASRLARRLGFSRQWFNGMKRDVYRRFNIKEIYEGDIA